jgi:hypothetical protein
VLGGGGFAWADPPTAPAAGEAPAAPVAAAQAPASPAPAARPAKPKAPPAYEVLRYQEDWSALRAKPACTRCDWGDRLKALRLGPCTWLDIGGQVRLRYEHFENFGFSDAGVADDGWLLARVRLHANLEIGRHLRFFAEGIYADQDDRILGPRPIDENHGDLLNLFGEVRGTAGATKLGVRAGRQELLYGRQRLVGPLDWGNTRRTFEGVVAYAKGQGWKAEGFFVQPVLVDIEEFDESADVDFAGVYYTNTCRKGTTWELYGFYYNNEEKAFFGVTGEDERFTLGGAARGPIAGTTLEYDVEAAVQLGTFADGDIAAWMATAEIAWKPCDVCWKPRLALGLDYASGDDDGPGGDQGTFHQLFPTGHLWFGWIDVVGRQNIAAGRVTLQAQPWNKVTLRGDLHAFWRAEEADALYNAAGAVQRAPGGSDELFVGTELDVVLTWAAQRHLVFEAGYGHFFAGEFLEETGPSEDIDFLYLSATLTF